MITLEVTVEEAVAIAWTLEAFSDWQLEAEDVENLKALSGRLLRNIAAQIGEDGLKKLLEGLKDD